MNKSFVVGLAVGVAAVSLTVVAYVVVGSVASRGVPGCISDTKTTCAGEDLSGVDLSGRDLRDEDLRKADLSGADLRYADLYDVNLSGADLSNADLR